MAPANENEKSRDDGGSSSHPFDCKHPMCIEWLDLRALRRLSEDTSADLVPQMVEVFIDELRERAAMIETAAHNSDLESLERESHIIKSSASIFGVPSVRAAAERLNKACRADDGAAASCQVESLAVDIPQTIVALQVHCGLPDCEEAE